MDGRVGFIQNKMDLKVLILYILSRLPEPISREDLADVTLLCDNAIGYFDFSECLSELISTGHVVEKDDSCAITDKGRSNGEATESGLPYAVRVRAEHSAGTLAGIQRRNAMITTSHELRSRGGYTVSLGLSDGMGTVMSLDILVGDGEQAKSIEKRFRDEAESVYLKIVKLLLENDRQP